MVATLTTSLLGLDAVQDRDTDQRTALGLVGLSLIPFVTFTVVERRTENPIIDGELLQRPVFLCSCVASWLLGFVFFLFLFITAVYLQEELGYSALAAGIALVPFSLVLAVTGVMSGRLTKRFQLATRLIVSALSWRWGWRPFRSCQHLLATAGWCFRFCLSPPAPDPGLLC